MYVKEKTNKNNELSIELRASGKNPYTKEYKLYVTTIKVPSILTKKKEIEQFKKKCEIDWQQEVDKRSKGIHYIQDEKVVFCDYAEMWVEDIIRYKKDAYNHYVKCKNNLEIFKEKFGLLTLQELTLPVVQEFCDWLCDRTYKKEIITVKKSIKEVIKEKGLSFKEVYQGSNISDATLCSALTIGNKVSRTTADSLCKFLNIRLETYFDVNSQNVYYSKSANKGLRTMLHTILDKAVKEGRIETNYASQDYVGKLQGEPKVKVILENEQEIKEFVSYVKKEPDIRKRVGFLIPLDIGCRGAEITGLSWDNINFETNMIKIEKNTMYISGFGIITKKTKNKSSNREVRMTDSLAELLKEYKVWWDNQKELFRETWGNTNKLFVQSNGSDMANQTIAKWLDEFEERNNLKKVTLHGLRHTNITMLITNGMDVKTVAARVGHKDVRTTLNIYSHYTKESDNKASQKVNELLYG